MSEGTPIHMKIRRGRQREAHLNMEKHFKLLTLDVKIMTNVMPTYVKISIEHSMKQIFLNKTIILNVISPPITKNPDIISSFPRSSLSK